jgi:hypothetical protein
MFFQYGSFFCLVLFFNLFLKIDVSLLRLDFESFTLSGPSITTEENGGDCQDKFNIKVKENKCCS